MVGEGEIAGGEEGREERFREERQSDTAFMVDSFSSLVRNCVSMAEEKIGARRGRKSNPTLPKLSPKYMACPRMLSKLVTPLPRSSTTVLTNCSTFLLSQELALTVG